MAWKMGKEVLVHGLLARVPVPTPTILFSDRTRQVIDASYALMTRQDGRAASQVTGDLDPVDVGDIRRQVGAIRIPS